MREYKVYFEIYGKKLCKTLIADNEGAAMQQVQKDIKFYKVVKADGDFNDAVDMLNNLFKGKK